VVFFLEITLPRTTADAERDRPPEPMNGAIAADRCHRPGPPMRSGARHRNPNPEGATPETMAARFKSCPRSVSTGTHGRCGPGHATGARGRGDRYRCSADHDHADHGRCGARHRSLNGATAVAVAA
jgi:hypothetical protein